MGYKPKGGEIMNQYESVIIINPSLEEEGVKNLVTKFKDFINTDGKVEYVEEMGKKKLAYEVKKNKEDACTRWIGPTEGIPVQSSHASLHFPHSGTFQFAP